MGEVVAAENHGALSQFGFYRFATFVTLAIDPAVGRAVAELGFNMPDDVIRCVGHAVADWTTRFRVYQGLGVEQCMPFFTQQRHFDRRFGLQSQQRSSIFYESLGAYDRVPDQLVRSFGSWPRLASGSRDACSLGLARAVRS